MLKGDHMDLSSITDALHTVMPTLSYIIDLFEKILMVLGSYLGIDLISTPAEEGSDEEPPVVE